MCGIAGHLGPEPLRRDRVEACLALMGRRGPDATGVYEERRMGRSVQLLHSRLSIIDLDARADQPLRTGSAVLAYNGELYNYVEVRAALEREGVTFQTSSDTEVLNAALGVWGPAALERCEGMWAFARYDESDGTLLLCRDRFGEKPLYLYEDDGGLTFGSEVKFLSALRGRGFRPDLDHLRRYLVNGYKALYKQPRTFFEGVRELEAATALRVTPEGAETTRYWAPSFQPDDTMSYEDAVSGAREHVIDAVRLRLRADVPLAFCMSGGVDSNALISVAKRVFGYDVHGYTIVNTDARYEEQDMVEAAVHELGIAHTDIGLDTSGFLGKLRRLVRHHDAPVYTITYYAHWLLRGGIAADGYRVSVSGTAADELFSGYYDHHLMYLAHVHDDPSRHAEALEAWKALVEPVVRNPWLRDVDLFVDDPGFRDHIFLDADAFAAYLTQPWCESFAETPYCDDLLRNRMLNELRHEAVPVILHEDDLNSMDFSIENRSPFLDRALVEFCATVPTRHLVRDGRAKAVLRDAMAGIMPEEVRTNHRKVGFNAPIDAFLDVDDPAVRSELLADSPIWDVVRRDRLAELLERRGLPNSQSKFLFYFLNAKLFLEELGGEPLVERPAGGPAAGPVEEGE